jgi:tRNA-2-methylthio-N6-dimethylallyladenosine synthase
VDERIKSRRLTILQELQDRHTLEKNQREAGRTLEVLVEGTSRNTDADLTGRTRTNRIVNFPGDGAWIGRTVPVAIREAFLHSLRGEAVLPGLRSAVRRRARRRQERTGIGRGWRAMLIEMKVAAWTNRSGDEYAHRDS